MKFDPELMRAILLDVESLPAGEPFVGKFTYDSRSQPEVNEHTQILIDDGYIDGNSLRDHRNVPIGFAITGLTMKGHDFLAKAKNDTAWDKVIVWSKQQGTALSATAVKTMLEQAVKSLFGG
jgi:hypothetical protein